MPADIAETSILEIIVVAFLVSTILNIILKKYDFPTIIGYIATGTIIAYSFNLHNAVQNVSLKEVAEFGVVFLMFTIGLEFSINKMKSMRYEVFITGTLQVVLSSLIFFAISIYFFGLEYKHAIIIAMAMSLSSTAIVLKILNENGDINKSYGQRVLGILLFQDIAVIPILLMITIFAQPDKNLTDLLAQTALSAVFLIFLLWIIGKYLLDYLFKMVTKLRSQEIFISTILLIVMGTSYLAHALGFSYSLGAFAAGMIIAESHYKHQVEADLVPFRDLLLGVFFITVGMQINFNIIKDHLDIVLLLLVGLVAIKMLVIYLIVRLKATRRVSFKTALSLFQVGEFALAIFELARSKNLFDPELGQILIVTVVLSMVITPFILKNLYFFVPAVSTGDLDTEPPEIDHGLKDHVVLIGYSYFGEKVAGLLRARHVRYVIVEHDIELVKKARSNHHPIIFGNAAKHSILEALSIKKAMSVIVAIDNPEKLRLICSAVNDLTHNANTIVKVSREGEKEALLDLSLTHIIVEGDEISHRVVEDALQCDISKGKHA